MYPGGWCVTLEPRFSCLVLDHQGLEELELKKHRKTAVFDKVYIFLSGFMVLLKVDGGASNGPKSGFWGRKPTHRYPWVPLVRWSSF